ncbi:MAG: fibronectin/fibrinogen-binding protein [Ruminococcaceae bacterium]|nr:fibronectin/fibrinogen-binding protein [Oscillospiraceae bacterium]
MALDGIVISALAKECEKRMVGARIDKIHQPEKDELIIGLRAPGDALKLLICANPSFPRFHITNSQKENPEKPPMFCMLLRKHISGGKILYVRQEGFERIVRIGIESYDELGYLSEKHLIIEIMGKHSNIILTDKDDKILDSIIHVDLSVSSVRQVLPGLPYFAPPEQGKKNPLDATRDDIAFDLSHDDLPVWKQIMNAYQGISPLVAREAVYRGVGLGEIMGPEASHDDLEKITLNFFAIMEDMKEGAYNPCVISDKQTKKMLDFCAIDIAQYGSGANIEHYPSMSEAVESFYMKKASSESIRQKCGDLSKTVATNLDRCRKKLQLQGEILAKAAKRDKYKIYGDLITANIYQISQGMEEVRVINFYSENAEEVTIPLKTDITPAKNAQRYYQKYNKEKTAEAETLKQKKLNEIEIDYLESVQEAILKAETGAEVVQIRDELIEEGYLKNRGRLLKKKKKEQITPMHFVSDDGYDIYVGKNNKQNDYVTLKLSRSTDIWFHTKGIHGSHTIVKCDDAMQVPDRTYMQAARLAAYYSKGRSSESVPVDYTEVKNVKKPSGAKPGMVIYVSYNTLYVTPDEEEAQRLRL